MKTKITAEASLREASQDLMECLGSARRRRIGPKLSAVSAAGSVRREKKNLRSSESLAAANQKLTQEIARRQSAESSLTASERHLKRLLRRSERMQGQMRDLSRRLLHAQEEERRRISRELHDEVLQTLVGINVNLENLGRDAPRDPSRLKPSLIRVQQLVSESVNAVHRFARELSPMILDDLGLLPALHSYLADFRERTGIAVQFTWFAEVERLSSARRTVLYRVVQCALANIVEHAGACRVEIGIQDGGNLVLLRIHDNGRSFDVARTLDARRYKRLGLLGMRERVEMVGGNFAIESSPGRGTTVSAVIPAHGVKGARRKAGANT